MDKLLIALQQALMDLATACFTMDFRLLDIALCDWSHVLNSEKQFKDLTDCIKLHMGSYY
jgi:hypothetical protein